MPQPVTAILTHQDALAARALCMTGDVNEARLLVGQVFSLAFRKIDKRMAADEVSDGLWRDLDRLNEKRKLS